MTELMLKYEENGGSSTEPDITLKNVSHKSLSIFSTSDLVWTPIKITSGLINESSNLIEGRKYRTIQWTVAESGVSPFSTGIRFAEATHYSGTFKFYSENVDYSGVGSETSVEFVETDYNKQSNNKLKYEKLVKNFFGIWKNKPKKEIEEIKKGITKVREEFSRELLKEEDR